MAPTTALVDALGTHGAAFMVISQVVANVMTLTVNVLAGARICFALSRDGIFPYSKYFRFVDPATQLPLRAVQLTTALAILLVSTVLASPVAFNALASYGIVAVATSYIFPIFGRISISRQQFDNERGPLYLGNWAIFLGWLACLYIIFIFIVLMLPTSYPITVSTFNFSPILVGISTIFLLFAWGIWGSKRFQGPGKPLKKRGNVQNDNEELLDDEEEDSNGNKKTFGIK